LRAESRREIRKRSELLAVAGYLKSVGSKFGGGVHNSQAQRIKFAQPIAAHIFRFFPGAQTAPQPHSAQQVKLPPTSPGKPAAASIAVFEVQ